MYIIDSVSLIHVRDEQDRNDPRTAAERARDFPHDLKWATREWTTVPRLGSKRVSLHGGSFSKTLLSVIESRSKPFHERV